MKLGEKVFVADGFRDARGNFVSGTGYTGLDTSIYAEVGIVEHLHAQAYLPFKIALNDFDVPQACSDGRRVRSSMRRSGGDANLALQWTSPWWSMPHALRVDGKIPMYDAGEPGGPCAGLFPEPGDGQVDTTVWLSAGDSLRDLPIYLFVEIGHRFRTEAYVGADLGRDYADTFVAWGQTGWGFAPGAFLMLGVGFMRPWRDDAVTKGSLVVAPALYVPVGAGFALEAGVDLTPWARNDAAGRAESLWFTAATVAFSHKLD